MKIVAVMGSPKGKGSGYKIARMIEDRMKAMGEVEFEYLFLKDANLKLCTGCYNCLAKGEDKCPLRDDRALIEQKLLAADGVILSSPVYVNNISWLMKNFMDRFAYANHRPRFHRQKVLTLVNSGGSGEKDVLPAFRYALGGCRIVVELGIATPPWPQTERAVAKKERAIDAAAMKFYQACLDTSLPSPTLYDYIVFLIRKKVYIDGRQILTADYAFYNGKTYYYDTKVNPVKVAAAKIIAGVLVNMFRDILPGDVPWPVAKKDE